MVLNLIEGLLILHQITSAVHVLVKTEGGAQKTWLGPQKS